MYFVDSNCILTCSKNSGKVTQFDIRENVGCEKGDKSNASQNAKQSHSWTFDCGKNEDSNLVVLLSSSGCVKQLDRRKLSESVCSYDLEIEGISANAVKFAVQVMPIMIIGVSVYVYQIIVCIIWIDMARHLNS